MEVAVLLETGLGWWARQGPRAGAVEQRVQLEVLAIGITPHGGVG
jgi:hypothetical protein